MRYFGERLLVGNQFVGTGISEQPTCEDILRPSDDMVADLPDFFQVADLPGDVGIGDGPLPCALFRPLSNLEWVKLHRA